MKSLLSSLLIISIFSTARIFAQGKEISRNTEDTISQKSLTKMMRVTSIPRDITNESLSKNAPQYTLMRITSTPRFGENKTRRTYDSLTYRYNKSKKGFWKHLDLKKKSEAPNWAILYPDPSMDMSTVLKIPNPYIKLIVTNFNQELIYENEWFSLLHIFNLGDVLPPGGYIVNAMGEDQVVVMKFIKK